MMNLNQPKWSKKKYTWGPAYHYNVVSGYTSRSFYGYLKDSYMTYFTSGFSRDGPKFFTRRS